jgi:hypothetical protein
VGEREFRAFQRSRSPILEATIRTDRTVLKIGVVGEMAD